MITLEEFREMYPNTCKEEYINPGDFDKPIQYDYLDPSNIFKAKK